MILQDITAPHLMMSNDISTGGDKLKTMFVLKHLKKPFKAQLQHK